MEVVDILHLDQLVQLPGTFDGPKYLQDYISVAAEECSGSYSQGSLSPETYISATDDTNFDLPDDLPGLNKEIVNGLVCEDPSFGSVLVNSEIIDIFNDYDESELSNALAEENPASLPTYQFVHDTPTRRKQRIVPKASQPFDEKSYTFNVSSDPKLSSRKRSHEIKNDSKIFSKKLILVTPVSSVTAEDSFDIDNGRRFKKVDSEKSVAFSSQPPALEEEKPYFKPEVIACDKLSSDVRVRKRGLTLDERKERKKQSNRNASFRYRQKKKEETDNFFQASSQVLEAYEKEKEAYQNIVEEFLRCIKHAQLVSHARGKN